MVAWALGWHVDHIVLEHEGGSAGIEPPDNPADTIAIAGAGKRAESYSGLPADESWNDMPDQKLIDDALRWAVRLGQCADDEPSRDAFEDDCHRVAAAILDARQGLVTATAEALLRQGAIDGDVWLRDFVGEQSS